MQRVIITGASSGIGMALARHYARRGALLGLVSRRKAELEMMLTQVRQTDFSNCSADVAGMGTSVTLRYADGRDNCNSRGALIAECMARTFPARSAIKPTGHHMVEAVAPR